jgi:hypothetical protein
MIVSAGYIIVGLMELAPHNSDMKDNKASTGVRLEAKDKAKLNNSP